MSYAGIDYGMGKTNTDLKTGIRYGVISQHSVGEAWYDNADPDYGEPTCPKCGERAEEYESNVAAEYNRGIGCADLMCEPCAYAFDSCEAYPDEARGYSYEADGYQLTSCLSTDIMVLLSPYYTLAQFCSPCVPGAGNLDSAMDEGVKTYCLGHDWFEKEVAPYTVYSVATGEKVEPETGATK